MSSATSERNGIPNISSERLKGEHPLKFGLGKKSFNTHLSSHMEVRSPNLGKLARHIKQSPIRMPNNNTMNSRQPQDSLMSGTLS